MEGKWESNFVCVYIYIYQLYKLGLDKDIKSLNKSEKFLSSQEEDGYWEGGYHDTQNMLAKKYDDQKDSFPPIDFPLFIFLFFF